MVAWATSRLPPSPQQSTRAATGRHVLADLGHGVRPGRPRRVPRACCRSPPTAAVSGLATGWDVSGGRVGDAERRCRCERERLPLGARRALPLRPIASPAARLRFHLSLGFCPGRRSVGQPLASCQGLLGLRALPGGRVAHTPAMASAERVLRSHGRQGSHPAYSGTPARVRPAAGRHWPGHCPRDKPPVPSAVSRASTTACHVAERPIVCHRFLATWTPWAPPGRPAAAVARRVASTAPHHLAHLAGLSPILVPTACSLPPRGLQRLHPPASGCGRTPHRPCQRPTRQKRASLVSSPTPRFRPKGERVLPPATK